MALVNIWRDGEIIEVEEGTLDLPPPPVFDVLAYTVNRRYDVQVGGVIWNGWPVHTDRDSISTIMAEVQAVGLGVRADGEPWKFMDSMLRPLTNAQVEAMAVAARAFVKDCYGVEFYVRQQLAADLTPTQAEVDLLFSALPSVLLQWEQTMNTQMAAEADDLPGAGLSE